MKKIELNSLNVKLSKWFLIILCFSITPMAMANDVDLWELNPLDNQTFVILFLWLLGFVILYFSLYRVFLKNQVSQGTHPHIFAHTLILLCAGGFLLVLFLELFVYVGLAWFAIVGIIYLLWLLIMVFSGKALRPIIFLLVIMAAIIAFRLANI